MKIILLIVGLFHKYGTWEKRVELYKKALEYIEAGHNFGFCGIFNKIEPRKDGWIGKLWLLPEIYWYKPWRSRKKEFWWSLNDKGMEKRRQILKEAIGNFEMYISVRP